MKKTFVKPEMKAASFRKEIKCADTASLPNMGSTVQYYSLQNWSSAQAGGVITKNSGEANEILKWHTSQ
ncbi:MAG: hypothetical protein ACI4TH_06655 [Candidatus Ornithomonoglobus sp.]